MAIQVLPEDIVQKIAAGEVIERPSSVVRELIENSLDAGATRIDVRIVGAGLHEILVADNGQGIPKHEVELAFQRHATSKISSVEDLEAIRTLGFRGEALASIASVSDVLLRTCHAGETTGTSARFAFGRKRAIRPDALAAGTIVRSRDLFANVPARRKFLRKPSTESQHVVDVVSRYAMAHPRVAFSLEVEGNSKLQTLGGSLLDAIRRARGPEIGDSLLPLESQQHYVRVTGYVSPPNLHRSSSRYIDIFVNGRWVQDRLLHRAILEAYRSLLPSGRYPMAIVILDLPPDRLDVNVHPAKSEVRFADPNLVFQAVFRAVRATVGDRAIVPRASGLPTKAADGEDARARHDALFSFPVDRRPVTTTGAHLETETKVTPRTSLPPLRVVGQVQQTYIVAEGPDGLYLVDQHAAHERILFERFLQQRSAGEQLSQGLVSTLPVRVGTDLCAKLPQLLPRLLELGFELEPFGDDVVAVRAIPAILAQRGGSVEQALVDVMDCLADGTEDRWLEHSVVRLVCHAAVRAGDTLDIPTMRDILRELEQTSSPRTCPHGRPTMVYFSADQVAREFGRR